MFNIFVTERELATILAALRHWQQFLECDFHGALESEHFLDCSRLNAIEIDDLCETLNTQTAGDECDQPLRRSASTDTASTTRTATASAK